MSCTDVRPEEDSDEEGEDIMESDDEEDIESETEEDRALIDDDVEEQGASFYRALVHARSCKKMKM